MRFCAAPGPSKSRRVTEGPSAAQPGSQDSNETAADLLSHLAAETSSRSSSSSSSDSSDMVSRPHSSAQSNGDALSTGAASGPSDGQPAQSPAVSGDVADPELPEQRLSAADLALPKFVAAGVGAADIAFRQNLEQTDGGTSWQDSRGSPPAGSPEQPRPSSTSGQQLTEQSSSKLDQADGAQQPSSSAKLSRLKQKVGLSGRQGAQDGSDQSQGQPVQLGSQSGQALAQGETQGGRAAMTKMPDLHFPKNWEQKGWHAADMICLASL